MPDDIRNELDYQELCGFRNSMAELHWLLLILVILYFFLPTGPLTDQDALTGSMVGYAAFILLIRYLGCRSRETRIKLAVETCAMTCFISAALWCTGMVDSPLLNLYLIVIIACAITLGRLMTLLEVTLIASYYLYMGFHVYSVDIVAPGTFTTLMAQFSPFLLVAWVTSMLASDLLEARRKIVWLSQTDELTGLLNLRAFNLALNRELAAASRGGEPLTIVMVDVDGLKRINDSFGHGAGSRLIRTIARAIEGSVRRSDMLARYGGDEFVVLMPRTDEKQARRCAERIRTAVGNSSCDVNGQRISTTVSIGFASFPETVQTTAELLDKADVALYRSKRDGRNRVTWYEPEPEALPA